MFEPGPGEWEGVLRSGRAWVRVCREGPLRPQWQGEGQVVSCYASESLYQALVQSEPEPPVNVAIG